MRAATSRAIFPPEPEQDLVRDFFGEGGDRFFVEVGAFEPQKNSQSFHLEQAGWRGVLVEPQPRLAERLRRERKAKVYEFACSSPDRAGTRMALYIEGGGTSLDPDWIIAGQNTRAAIEVSVETLDHILADAQAPEPIDLLSIDVEGHEIEVLRGFDFSRWRPRLILLEDHVMSLDKHMFLSRHGYALIRRTGLNAWYVPLGEASALGLYGRLQILRKYYLALPFRKLRNLKRRVRDRIGAICNRAGR